MIHSNRLNSTLTFLIPFRRLRSRTQVTVNARMWNKGKTLSLLVRMQTCAATMENSMAVLQKGTN